MSIMWISDANIEILIYMALQSGFNVLVNFALGKRKVLLLHHI